MYAGVALQLALFAIAALLSCLGFAIAARRVYRNLVEVRAARRSARLRPIVIEALSEDEPDFSSFEGLSRSESKIVEAIVWQMLSKVKGASREALVVWLSDRGAVERERVRTHKFGSVRRAKAAEKLGAAGVATTSTDVARLLGDRHDEVRIVAARALGRIGDPESVPALLTALDADRGVPAGIVTMSLVHLGPSAIKNLTGGLGHRSASVRAVCVDLLGMHGAISAARWISLLLEHDRSEDVRVRAAHALGRIGLPQSVEVLRRGLASGNSSQLRLAAAMSLGLIGGDGAVGALHIAVNDIDESVGSVAAEALSRLGDSGTSCLREISQSEGPGVAHARHWLSREQLAQDAKRHRHVTERLAV